MTQTLGLQMYEASKPVVARRQMNAVGQEQEHASCDADKIFGA
jgi:hypothetical protein